MTLKEMIGSRIRRLRFVGDEQCLSQKEMAEKLGISSSDLSRIEAGNKFPGVDVLVRISQLTGVPVDYLFGTRQESFGALLDLGVPLELLFKVFRSNDGESKETVKSVIANTERLMYEQFRDVEFREYLRRDPEDPVSVEAFDYGHDVIELREHLLEALVKNKRLSTQERSFLEAYFKTHRITKKICEKHGLSNVQAMEIRQRFDEEFAGELRGRIE